jgi:short-subunit dehydrogenase
MATYAATKAFVTSFSEAIAEENRPFGIQTLALCPGSTKTNFQAAAKMEHPMHVKGQQNVEEVIETAMRAVKSKRTRIVSGFTNYIVSRIVNFVPNALITRALAKPMRARYQSNE